jgi:secreted trypsin-like serine protease
MHTRRPVADDLLLGRDPVRLHPVADDLLLGRDPVRLHASPGLLLALVMGCSSPADPEIGSVSSAVVGGTPVDASTYSATGALLSVSPSGRTLALCTATLVAPGTVLTAAHCVAKSGAEVMQFSLAAGVAEGGETRVGVSRVYVHPAFDPTATGPMHDLALAQLNATLTGVGAETILQPNEDANVITPGAMVELVGYGSTSQSGLWGDKNAAAARIAAVDTTEMTIGAPGQAQNCVGDSGGPSFVVLAGGKRRIAGVVSRSANDASECVDGSIHTRVDAHAEWVLATLSRIEGERSAAGCAVGRFERVSSEGAQEAALAGGIVFAIRRRRKRSPRAGA